MGINFLLRNNQKHAVLNESQESKLQMAIRPSKVRRHNDLKDLYFLTLVVEYSQWLGESIFNYMAKRINTKSVL